MLCMQQRLDNCPVGSKSGQSDVSVCVCVRVNLVLSWINPNLAVRVRVWVGLALGLGNFNPVSRAKDHRLPAGPIATA